jgi:hypothetical protein
LELAYLSDPSIYGRDSQTRRGAARKKLKEITGMDDAQLEGWKIMLERNVRISTSTSFYPPYVLINVRSAAA